MYYFVVGFSDDPRRLNVLLTRARRGLVVVTHMATFVDGDGASRIWAGWAEGAAKVKELQFEQPKTQEPKNKKVNGRNKRNNNRRKN